MKRIFVVAIALSSLLGCSGPEVVSTEESPPGAVVPIESGIWDVEEGMPLRLEEFIGDLEEATFVVVGESHGTPWDHAVQQKIVEELVASNMEIGVGLEMIERRFQQHLDAYLAGEIDEEQMLRRVEWEERWGVDKKFYAPHWRLARNYQLPVVALNARRELVSEVGEVGIDGLDPRDRARLPDIEGDDEYRARLREIFGAHDIDGENERTFENFFEAQLVWDETMAETASEFMSKTDEIDQMVILTGRGHMERGHGIVPRLVRRGARQDEVLTVVPVSTDGERGERMEKYRDLEFLRDEQIADYVWLEP